MISSLLPRFIWERGKCGVRLQGGAVRKGRIVQGGRIATRLHRVLSENSVTTTRIACSSFQQVAEKPRSDSPFRTTVLGESAAYVAKWVSDPGFSATCTFFATSSAPK